MEAEVNDARILVPGYVLLTLVMLQCGQELDVIVHSSKARQDCVADLRENCAPLSGRCQDKLATF